MNIPISRLKGVSVDSTPVRIIIVEDEPAHAEAIRRAMEAAGTDADIQVVSTLREYREKVAADRPDIALIDLNLPDGQAVEVLASPSESGRFPILVMTSYGNEQTAESAEGRRAGLHRQVIRDLRRHAPHRGPRLARMESPPRT